MAAYPTCRLTPLVCVCIVREYTERHDEMDETSCDQSHKVSLLKFVEFYLILIPPLFWCTSSWNGIVQYTYTLMASQFVYSQPSQAQYVGKIDAALVRQCWQKPLISQYQKFLNHNTESGIFNTKFSVPNYCNTLLSFKNDDQLAIQLGVYLWNFTDIRMSENKFEDFKMGRFAALHIIHEAASHGRSDQWFVLSEEITKPNWDKNP